MPSSPSPSPSPSASPSPTPPATATPPSAVSGGGGGAVSSRRLPPPCWTHEETLALIHAYRDKWLSLGRGPLRAAHWDDVATDVAARCPAASPSKTPLQCRHKVEKLRKRYRSERHRSLQRHPSNPSPWVYFPLLHSLEQPPPSSNGAVVGGGGGGDGGLKFTFPKAARSRASMMPPPTMKPSSSSDTKPRGSMLKGFGGPEEVRRVVGSKRKGEREEAAGEMVAAVRMLGERFIRMEQMKMEMAREMERASMEAELKRTEMVLEEQRRLVETFVEGFVGSRNKKKEKRVKASPES